MPIRRSWMAVRGSVLGAGAARRHSTYVVAYRIATGATGVPVPPTNGSGIADSRKA
ncbi:hypothetical protein STSP_45480 [Streptomyces jeddahensis]|uniref:Uncharacterized protein n=1 Tax=Streptomyces jeddahensis TaxID=1716141 RepID=A0A177HNW3_9ACTN|nr:hypothetical protein STSP_45480 [Streptomyces jeddahensis]